MSFGVTIYMIHRCDMITDNYVEVFFINHLKPLFVITDYSLTKAIVGKLINIIATFLWSFMDLFIMVISIGLATRFKHFNLIFSDYKGKVSKSR